MIIFQLNSLRTPRRFSPVLTKASEHLRKFWQPFTHARVKCPNISSRVVYTVNVHLRSTIDAKEYGEKDDAPKDAPSIEAGRVSRCTPIINYPSRPGAWFGPCARRITPDFFFSWFVFCCGVLRRAENYGVITGTERKDSESRATKGGGGENKWASSRVV